MKYILLRVKIRKFEKRKVHLPLINNIRGANLVDKRLISKFNKVFWFLLCLTYIPSNIYYIHQCPKVVPLKINKVLQLLILLKIFLDESRRKLYKILAGKGTKSWHYKIWVDKGSKFYYTSIKSWLQDNDSEMHSSNDEGKFVVAKRFIKTLNNKIYKYMTLILKNLYIDKVNEMINK